MIGVAFSALCDISIHAPARGATRFSADVGINFNISIHAPARGATVIVVLFVYVCNISIHAPARGATSCDVFLYFAYHISIHAPARGATLVESSVVSTRLDFNPRSREGSDLHGPKSTSPSSSFQSTLPRGERLFHCHVIVICLFVFQSTLPRGERLQKHTNN